MRTAFNQILLALLFSVEGSSGVATVDDGNLIILSGAVLSGLIFEDGLESGNVSAWSSSIP